MAEKKIVYVNRTLGIQPKIGPFPAEQVFPWACIAICNVFIFYYMLNVGWLATGFITCWGWGTWWIVSSNRNFFTKFIGLPQISRGYMPFVSVNSEGRKGKKGKRAISIRKNR